MDNFLQLHIYRKYLPGLSVEYARREVLCLSFIVKTSLLPWATEVVSIGNILFH